MARIYIFARFERFWHWAQALLIIGMLITGFEIHGSYTLLGFEGAHSVHTTAAWALITLWVFAIFWHFTTGEWRQYIPTMKNIDKIVRFYAVGIFRGEPHPYRVSEETNFNALQALSYWFIMYMVMPLMLLSGLLFLFPEFAPDRVFGFDGLLPVAVVHYLTGAVIVMFMIAHIYLGTTGTTVTSMFKTMINGWHEHVGPEESRHGDRRHADRRGS